MIKTSVPETFGFAADRALRCDCALQIRFGPLHNKHFLLLRLIGIGDCNDGDTVGALPIKAGTVFTMRPSLINFKTDVATY